MNIFILKIIQIFSFITNHLHSNNIKDFLNEKKFEKCKKIFLNWVIHTDNNLFFYDNRTLHERFPELEPNAIKKKKIVKCRVKTIIRGKNLINGLKVLSTSINGCNGNGKEIKIIDKGYIKNPDFENYFIDHYYSKSLEEFVEKVNKGDGFFEQSETYKFHRIKRYFLYNKKTLEKIKYIEKKTGLNLEKLK